jgi:hypothetical protein
VWNRRSALLRLSGRSCGIANLRELEILIMVPVYRKCIEYRTGGPYEACRNAYLVTPPVLKEAKVEEFV